MSSSFSYVPGKDEVIPNDKKIIVKNGDHFHSQPPADYGLWGRSLPTEAGIAPERARLYAENGGWTFVVISDFELPMGFEPNQVDLLVKLPPGFPDAAPDMFWVHPAVQTTKGGKRGLARRPASACSGEQPGRGSPGIWPQARGNRA